jgi:hypothetical protein
MLLRALSLRDFPTKGHFDLLMPSSVNNMPRAPDPIGIGEQPNDCIFQLTFFLGISICYNYLYSFHHAFPKKSYENNLKEPFVLPTQFIRKKGSYNYKDFFVWIRGRHCHQKTAFLVGISGSITCGFTRGIRWRSPTYLRYNACKEGDIMASRLLQILIKVMYFSNTVMDGIIQFHSIIKAIILLQQCFYLIVQNNRLSIFVTQPNIM